MKMRISRKRLLQCSIAATCILPLMILTSLEAMFCSWDYLIWMPRDRQVDPLYRFVRNGKAGYIDQSGKVVIEPKFEVHGNYGGEFRNGLMEIGISDGKYVDTTGKLLIDRGY